MRTDPATRADPDADLPAVVAVRPHAEGDETTVVRFGNGAELRYRPAAVETDDADETPVTEEWVSPDGDRLRRERAGDPERLALRALGAYLSFESRARAEFVWGAENLATLLGE